MAYSQSRTIKQILKSGLGWGAGLSGVYRRHFRDKMTIVAFHRVTDSLPPDGLTCSASKFEAFCRFFQRHFTVVSLAEQVAASAAGKRMGGTLSITFDDGYRDNYEIAMPILRKLGLPATFFVVTGFIESKIVPPWDADLPAQSGWMTWAQVKQLAAGGFDIGGHTDTHIDMGSSDIAAVRLDLEVAKQKFDANLGFSPQLFAYPFGGREHITPASRRLVREAGFICCASCYGGVNPDLADPFALNRVGIGDWFENPDQFGFELMMNKA
jgi:peptidoglycan/xylan/chitin deacetylase (PgdA/CDA1 family)